MLKAKAKPLEGPSRNEIEISPAALRVVMNSVELYYTDSQTVYEQFIVNHDGEYLISILKHGLRYKGVVREMKIAHEDLIKSFR